jgi:hypothetical protein
MTIKNLTNIFKTTAMGILTTYRGATRCLSGSMVSLHPLLVRNGWHFFIFQTQSFTENCCHFVNFYRAWPIGLWCR